MHRDEPAKTTSAGRRARGLLGWSVAILVAAVALALAMILASLAVEPASPAPPSKPPMQFGPSGAPGRSDGSADRPPTAIGTNDRERSALVVTRGPSETRQACGRPMLTIQGMPNRSTHMPNSSPHICFSKGTDTVPPSDSFSQ